MPQINKTQAKEFLDKISNKDHIAILFHNDLDGFVSGVLLLDWCEKKGAKAKVVPFTMTDDQNRAIKETSDCNKILLADLAPTAINKVLESIKNKEVFYTDHHIREIKIPKEILEYRTPGELSSSKAVYQLIGENEFLKILSEFADAGWKCEENRKEIDKFLKEKNWALEDFFQKVTYPYDRTIIYFHNDLNKAFNILRKINSVDEMNKVQKYNEAIGDEIKKFVKEFEQKQETFGKIHFYYFEPKYPIKSAVINEISYSNPNETFVFAVLANDLITISGRNQSKKQNMVGLLQELTKGIPNASVGGHIPAAGARITKNDLEKLKDNLKRISPE